MTRPAFIVAISSDITALKVEAARLHKYRRSAEIKRTDGNHRPHLSFLIFERFSVLVSFANRTTCDCGIPSTALHQLLREVLVRQAIKLNNAGAKATILIGSGTG